MKTITLPIIAATLIGCSHDHAEHCEVPVETVKNQIDYRSISGEVTYTLDRDVNHIGHSTMKKVFNSELRKAMFRANNRLEVQGLPAGTMRFKEN